MIKHAAWTYDSGNKPTWNLIISKMVKASNKILNKLNTKRRDLQSQGIFIEYLDKHY